MNKNPSMNSLVGPMRQGLAATISKYLVNPLDRKRLRYEVPLSRSNSMLCLPSGTHPNQNPEPVFRSHPGVEGCSLLTASLGECCVSDLRFALKVAIIMRTAVPGLAPPAHIARIANEMLRWVNGLYASPLAVAGPTNHLILHPGQYPDDDNLADFATKMQCSAAVVIRVQGQNASLPRCNLHFLRGELKICGPVGSGTTVDTHEIWNILYNPNGSTITNLVLQDCAFNGWYRRLHRPLADQLACAISVMGGVIPVVEMDLPVGLTRSQLQTALVGFWGWDAGVPPASPTGKLYANFTLHLTYDPTDRRVTCRQQPDA